MTVLDRSIDKATLEAAWKLLVSAASRHEYGGAVALVTIGGEQVLYRATGWAVREPVEERAPMAVDSIFDLASLTKVTATTPAILQLVDAGRIGLDQPVGEILDEFGTSGRLAQVTIHRLMSHSAGFRDWLPVFLEAHGADAYLRAFAASQPEHEPGSRIIYSDPSFITLGEVVKRVTGQSIAEYAAANVFAPLGMKDTRYAPPPQWRERIVATERGNDFEAAKAPDHAPNGSPWRSGLIRGQVHDGNAWYGFGGIAGHAGLFGTATDLVRYGRAWLTGELPGISAAIIEAATTEQSGVRDTKERRGLGWRLTPTPNEDPEDSALGLGPRAYGHTGFTGTSLWMDPDRDLVVVLLTNRVHPTVTTEYMATRATFTRMIAEGVR